MMKHTMVVSSSFELATNHPQFKSVSIEYYIAAEAEAALAERDKRISELEALVEWMKCCQNCDVYNKNANDIPFSCNVCVKHNKWRMK